MSDCQARPEPPDRHGKGDSPCDPVARVYYGGAWRMTNLMGLLTPDGPTDAGRRVVHYSDNSVNSLAHCVRNSIVSKNADIVTM